MQSILNEITIIVLILCPCEVCVDIITDAQDTVIRNLIAHNIIKPSPTQAVNRPVRLPRINNFAAHILIFLREGAAAINFAVTPSHLYIGIGADKG